MRMIAQKITEVAAVVYIEAETAVILFFYYKYLKKVRTYYMNQLNLRKSLGDNPVFALNKRLK
ncbi:hypothetical protein UA3_00243 [Enterococcus faecium EnGen0263]|uniref:Uncharacterized protein n=1 Tax=Enterococcus faecium TaxID=1352 RepID=A0A242FM32_ENTFC|nr:hypothetical protein UA3_00243 [Enterococcus faecium EnGen0263]OTN93120.1 hypothetical protein A5810_002579 [Enterococcus faecium]OTO22977.1 hypothetical protein A5816_001927 [Enterococcus sp. 3G1_DIV0629]OTO52204.1 hypothetical protein A5814_000287 [Enterococcus faecium]